MGRLYTTLSVVSLLLCTVTCGLGMRGYWAHDILSAQLERKLPVDQHDFYKRKAYELHSRDGTLSLVSSNAFSVPAPNSPDPMPTDAQWPLGSLTFGFHSNFDGQPADGGEDDQQAGLQWGWRQTVLGSLDLKPVAALFLLLAIAAAMVGRWQRPPAFGRCAVCGYDLRTVRGRCPKCGTSRRKKAAVST